MANENRPIIKAHCNECLRETNHEVLAKDEFLDQDSDSDAYCTVTSSMLKCCGCGHICLQRVVWFSESDTPDVIYFPPSVSRKEPDWLFELPEGIVEMLQEVYAALHADSCRLVVMGVRTAIDLLLTDKVGNAGTFAQRLEKLQQGGFLSVQGKQVLETALDAGHAANHRGHKASSTEIKDLLAIVENLLHAVYVTPQAADRLKQSTPQR